MAWPAGKTSTSIAASDCAGQDTVLSVRGLKTWFYTPGGTARAVDGVDFDVGHNDIVALVGESGSGKSVTALSILKLVPVPPGRYVEGEVWIEGRNILTLDERQLQSVRGELIGMIFQSPRNSLDPSFTVRSQLIETIRRHSTNLSRTKTLEEARRGLIEVGFPDPDRVLASYPHQLSGGMCQRVALAMALACRPRLLIADEPTTALDVGVQAKILLLLKRRHRLSGLPILIITHDFGVVRAVATRVVVMYAGQVQEEGTVDDVLDEPLHPYTQALINSVPDPEGDAPLRQIPGEPPNLMNIGDACRFVQRCEKAMARCHAAQPRLSALGNGRRVRCHLYDIAAAS